MLLLIAGLNVLPLIPPERCDGNIEGFWMIKPSISELKKVRSAEISLLKNEPRRLTEYSVR